MTGPCRGGPGHSLGAVVDQDALADGEGAVVPHQEEVKHGVCHPGSHRAGCEGTGWGHRHPDSPWDTHPQGKGPAPHHPPWPQRPQRPPHLQGSVQMLYQDLLFTSEYSRMGEKGKGALGGELCPAPRQTHLELRRNRQEKETMRRMMVR